MLIVLPPSETKRDGGDEGTRLDLGSLGFPRLSGRRRAVLAALRRLGSNRSAMASALHLGATQQFEVERNRAVTGSPTMPALDRYTGVLFDALDTSTLGEGERAFAYDHVAIHSALFGLIRGADPIPAYRLSHNSRLPDLSLKKTWRDGVRIELEERPDLVLDLRSDAYVALGPADGANHHLLRVVTQGPDGKRHALSHFNKKSKGEFVRALCRSGIDHPNVESVIAWCRDVGIRLIRPEGHDQDGPGNDRLGHERGLELLV